MFQSGVSDTIVQCTLPYFRRSVRARNLRWTVFFSVSAANLSSCRAAFTAGRHCGGTGDLFGISGSRRYLPVLQGAETARRGAVPLTPLTQVDWAILVEVFFVSSASTFLELCITEKERP